MRIAGLFHGLRAGWWDLYVRMFYHISDPSRPCNRKWMAARHGQKRLSLLPQWRSEGVLLLVISGLQFTKQEANEYIGLYE